MSEGCACHPNGDKGACPHGDVFMSSEGLEDSRAQYSLRNCWRRKGKKVKEGAGKDKVTLFEVEVSECVIVI